ncbi:hypothetical protein I4U23_007707 [Adineta vaga]|nr:hypothetical protein I4U23_007707 [Adineta vaga]
MLIICSSCGLLTSWSQHRTGCKLAPAEPLQQSASMTDFTSNRQTNLFTASSNEHTLFAGTLRNWGDPLLQGYEPTPVPLCPRCATCRCESLKALPRTSVSRKYHHHHQKYHEPSCPNYRQHERAKTASKQRTTTKIKRRANSYDSSVTLDHRPLIMKQNTEYSSSTSSTPLIKQRNNKSKIPVRISTSSSNLTTTTTTSEYSPASSIHESHSSNAQTKLPRPLIKSNASSTTVFTHTNQTVSSSDEDFNEYDQDSLDDNAYETSSPIPTNEFFKTNRSSKKKKKNMMMYYCALNNSDHFDDMDEEEEELLMKKKKRLTPSRKHTHSKSPSPSSSSSPEKRQRRLWYKEG